MTHLPDETPKNTKTSQVVVYFVWYKTTQLLFIKSVYLPILKNSRSYNYRFFVGNFFQFHRNFGQEHVRLIVFKSFKIKKSFILPRVTTSEQYGDFAF